MRLNLGGFPEFLIGFKPTDYNKDNGNKLKQYVIKVEAF